MPTMARMCHLARVCAVTVAIASCLGAGNARAADEPAEALQSSATGATELTEITVTATRRSESVFDTPLAIDAYSGTTLENFGVQSLQDLNKINASVTINNFGATQQQIVIRGISSDIAATSGLYLDESPLLGGFQNNFRGDGTPGLRLIDVERVEVLEGPQGTLFGSGSMAGTLRIISRKPDLDVYGGSLTVRAASVTGGDGYFDGNAVLNVPLIQDTLGVRVVTWGETGGGFISQSIGGRSLYDVNNADLKGARASVLLRRSDFSLNFSVNYQATDVDGAQFWNANLWPYHNSEPSLAPYEDHYTLYNLTADYDVHVGDLIGIVTHGSKHTLQPFDSSPTNCSFGLCPPLVPPLSFVPQLNFRDTTGELRFVSKFSGPVQVVAGGYYEQDRSTYEGSAVYDDPGGYAACIDVSHCEALGLRNPGNNLTGTPSNYLEFGNVLYSNIHAYAAYGQVDWNIISPLSLTIGARYSSADIRVETQSTQDIAPPSSCNWLAGCVTTPYVTFNGSTRQSKPTYNFALLYKLSRDVNLYARAASGFRIGGINNDYNPANLPQVPLGYKPDSLWDYEGGLKAYFINRKLYVDLTIYHLAWTNEQIQGIADGSFQYTLNAGKTTTDGAQFDVTYLLTPGLTLNAALTYNDARLAQTLPPDVTAAGNGGNKGDPLPLSPRVVAALGLNYDFPITDRLRGYATASLSYRDSMQLGFNSTNEFYAQLPPYTLVDVKAGFRWSHYSFGLFVRNIGNAVAWTGLQKSTDGTRVFSPAPRTIGLSFTGLL